VALVRVLLNGSITVTLREIADAIKL